MNDRRVRTVNTTDMRVSKLDLPPIVISELQRNEASLDERLDSLRTSDEVHNAENIKRLDQSALPSLLRLISCSVPRGLRCDEVQIRKGILEIIRHFLHVQNRLISLVLALFYFFQREENVIISINENTLLTKICLRICKLDLDFQTNATDGSILPITKLPLEGREVSEAATAQAYE